MPPVKLFLLIVLAAVVLLLASCDVEFRWWSDTDSNVPAAKEVHRIVNAAYSGRLDETLSNLYATLNRADGTTRSSALYIESGVPGLIARIDDEIVAARPRVAAVDVKTPPGRCFRSTVLQGFGRQRVLYHAFAAALQRRRDTWTTLDRFAAKFDTLNQWFGVKLTTCLAVADPDDRPAVRAALGRY